MVKSPRPSETMPDYWEIIRYDSTAFLCTHAGYESRLYHGQIAPNASRDVFLSVRTVFRGIARLLLDMIASASRPSPRVPRPRSNFFLLATVGGPKYAGEERELVEACRKHGLEVLTVHMIQYPQDSARNGTSATMSILTPGDYARALGSWLKQIVKGARWVLSRDAKQRSLAVAALFAMRQYSLYVAFARRVRETCGTPGVVLSLAPSSAVSVALVEHMRSCGVLTAGIRTQTTSAELEFVAINTDILFCKGPREKQAYETVLGQHAPQLEAGCIFSQPVVYELKPLDLPGEYALLLGTSPRYDQTNRDNRIYEEKLLQVAAAVGLPSVFKEHNLWADWKGEPRDIEAGDPTSELVVTDMRRNRELIDRASLVVSHPSTLLYYVLLRGIPTVIVESFSSSLLPDEFLTSPIPRIAYDEEVVADYLDLWRLRSLAAEARLWLADNYHLEKGAEFVVEYLAERARRAAGTGSRAAVQ